MLTHLHFDTSQSQSDLNQVGKSHTTAFKLCRAAVQSVKNCVDEQWQSSDSLNGKHEQTVQGQRLAHWARLESSQTFLKLRFYNPVENVMTLVKEIGIG